jgi:hypothetical protein
MQTKKLTNKPVANVIAAIQALDLESVKIRLMDPELGEGWSREYADSIESAYKTYLTMLAKHQEHAEEIMLAKDVDEFWHTHILQTMKYAEDCDKVFGAFLHHNPHVGPRTDEDTAKRATQTDATRKLYEREFGSKQAAEVAWAGAPASGSAAYSNAGVQAQSAYSNAAVRAADVAYSNAAVRVQQTAYSNASVRNAEAAYSNAAVSTKHAAYSNAAVGAQNAAYSNAAISVRKTAYSNAAIRARDAAYSNASLNA